MLNIEKTVSNLIESQFPFFLQEEGPVFIEFVKQYYIWMESQQNNVGGPIYHARRLSEYRDIDNTVDSFLVYFKEKYLKNIQFKTAASLKRMVKHSLDLYRSKGTPRAIDLLFKVVFDTPATVYLPSTDIFRLSSGDYYQQYYLEVTPSPYNIVFVGKQIVGLQSEASAFIEKLIRKKIKGTYVEVFVISNITGNFITGEIIKTSKQTEVVNNPKIVGSLTKARVITGSKNFSIGDIVDIDSTQGSSAKGRITAVADVNGKVEFTLIDGGFGFTKDANVYISEKILRISNVNTNTAISNVYFTDYNLLVSPQASISVINFAYSNGNSTVPDINPGDVYYNYYSNGSIKGTSVVQGSNKSSNTAGILYVSIISGNVNCIGAGTVNGYYNTGNTISANIGIAGVVNQTATANIIGTTGNVIITYANSLPFSNNEYIYQLANNGTYSAYAKIIGLSTTSLSGTVTVSNTSGLFLPSANIYGVSSGRNANATNISVDVGVVNISNQFYSNAGNYTYVNDYTGNLYTTGTILSLSKGALADFQIADTLGNQETIEIDTDYLSTYSSIALNANNYGFKPSLVTNTNSTIANSLNFAEKTLGTILNITGINNGEEYNVAPIIKIDEPLISQYNIKDIDLQVSNVSATFYLGEIVTQSNTGAKGIVTASNSNYISLRNISFENSFSNTVSNTIIVGSGSGTTGYVNFVYSNNYSKSMGVNSIVFANVVTEIGSVTSLDIIDSGLGYQHDELGTFSSLDGERVGTAIMLLGNRTSNTDAQGTQGKTLGFYRNRDGFLSDSKKLYDGYYYQEYSYEIRSAVTLDKYEAMLKQLLHVAGTKYFASTIISSNLPVQTNIDQYLELINVTVDNSIYKSDSTLITSDLIYKQ